METKDKVWLEEENRPTPTSDPSSHEDVHIEAWNNVFSPESTPPRRYNSRKGSPTRISRFTCELATRVLVVIR